MSIIFLFTGNARTFPFNIYHNMRNAEILDSYNKYIFTDKFKSLYKYKIYISTDDIHLSDTIYYFSENIGNIHLLNILKIHITFLSILFIIFYISFKSLKV